jgi:hypothetical protein
MTTILVARISEISRQLLGIPPPPRDDRRMSFWHGGIRGTAVGKTPGIELTEATGLPWATL